MVQRLAGGLAQQIVQREPILDAQGRVDRSVLKPLFDRLMTFNPSVELYVVSSDGELLADAAPPGHIQRQKIDISPLQTFLSGAAMPVYGDDPRSQSQKVFSVTPLRQDGELKGYLYIILQGEESNAPRFPSGQTGYLYRKRARAPTRTRQLPPHCRPYPQQFYR